MQISTLFVFSFFARYYSCKTLCHVKYQKEVKITNNNKKEPTEPIGLKHIFLFTTTYWSHPRCSSVSLVPRAPPANAAPIRAYHSLYLLRTCLPRL